MTNKSTNSKFYAMAAGLIFLATIAIIVFPGAQEALNKYTTLNNTIAEISTVNKQLIEARDSYRSEKTAYAERAKNDAKFVESILPVTNNETAIMREVETYANELIAPQKLTSISFGKPENKDMDYSSIPFKAHLNLSADGLSDLLSKLSKTGQVRQNAASRLLSVQKIDINITDPQDMRLLAGENKGEVEVDLMINAYTLPNITNTKKATATN